MFKFIIIVNKVKIKTVITYNKQAKVKAASLSSILVIIEIAPQNKLLYSCLRLSVMVSFGKNFAHYLYLKHC